MKTNRTGLVVFHESLNESSLSSGLVDSINS